MSKETRTIRPFVGIDELEGVLEEAVLYFGQEPCLANEGQTVTSSPHEFLLRPVSIEWGSDDTAFEGFRKRLVEGAETTELGADNLSLVVVASSSFLKISDVVFECRVSELDSLPRVTKLTREDRSSAFSTPFSGFVIDAYLLLTRSLEPRALRPHMRGTWIAWTRFGIHTTQAPAVLPPTPLTDEVRERYHLGARTIRFLHFGDHDLLEAYGQQERPTFYIDENLLAQMNARRTSAGSKALQLQLVLDFASAVIRRASSRSELTDLSYDDLRTSLLGSVIRVAAGPGATDQDRNRLLSQVADAPEFVIARTEHFIDVASGYAGLLTDYER